MLLFDIGANRGDAVVAGLNKGFTKIVALEPAPIIYAELVKNFIYDSRVKPLKLAASDKDGERIEFYEAKEDGLSTMNKDWLTGTDMPYKGKPYRTIKATTITIDTLVKLYGKPDLIKIDVEGAEWTVFKGMTKPHPIAFEWTWATIDEHIGQLKYLQSIGFTAFAPQFIEHHLQETNTWLSISDPLALPQWIENMSYWWSSEGWKQSGLRPTPDVGMCWVR